jgi:hypothetical protein
VLPERRCPLIIDCAIENAGEDQTFTSVGVSYEGVLKYDLAGRPWRADVLPVRYDPIVSNPLHPHEHRRFTIWWDINHALHADLGPGRSAGCKQCLR